MACRCDVCVRISEITGLEFSVPIECGHDIDDRLLPCKPGRLVPRLPQRFLAAEPL